MPQKSAIIVLSALLTVALHAEVKPNPLFSDGGVLQRDQKIPVWGTACDGEKVTVEIQGQKVSNTAADGKWSVHLIPIKESGSFTMTLTGDNTVTVNNLLVGEVWLCSGQSNMNFTFSSKSESQSKVRVRSIILLRYPERSSSAAGSF